MPPIYQNINPVKIILFHSNFLFCCNFQMNWYMRRKNSKPFLMNWIKLSPRCLATKNYFSYYKLSLLITMYFHFVLQPTSSTTTTLYSLYNKLFYSDLQASFSSFQCISSFTPRPTQHQSKCCPIKHMNTMNETQKVLFKVLSLFNIFRWSIL